MKSYDHLKINSRNGSNKSTKYCIIPKRYVVVILGFLGMACAYSMQVDLNMTVLAMNHVNQSISRNGSEFFVECPMLVDTNGKPESRKIMGARYDWDSEEQGLILASFYYGYVLTQLTGGYLAEVLSPKWMFGVGLLLSGLLSLLTPVAAALGTKVLVGLRIVQGLCQGIAKPSINVIISRWAPKLERSRFSTFLLTGGLVGSVVTMPLAGLIVSCDALGGWPSVFTFFGTVSSLWFILWISLFHDNPTDHPYITTSELDLFYPQKGEMPGKTSKVPWKKIFSSLPVWAVIVSHIGNNFGFFILFVDLPNYMENVLHFSFRENGVLSALPYVLQTITAWAAACAADKLRESERMKITTIRKIFNSIGLLGPAACIFCVTVSGCRPRLIVGFISLALALNGFTYSGFEVTHVDMCPKFAGTLFGITNTFATISGIVGPSLVGVLTANGETIPKWNKVFYVVVGMYVFAAVFYDLFASAELQDWESESDDNHPSETHLVAK